MNREIAFALFVACYFAYALYMLGKPKHYITKTMQNIVDTIVVHFTVLAMKCIVIGMPIAVCGVLSFLATKWIITEILCCVVSKIA